MRKLISKLRRSPKTIAALLLIHFVANGPRSDSLAGARDELRPNEVPVVVVREAITLAVSEQLTRALLNAKFHKNPAVFIELDTPGGFLEATRDIVQLMLNSEIPVIVWVNPPGARAASAGSMITMAAHYAAMAESTSIGAATPVSGDGKDIAGAMKLKIENDTLSFVEGIAERRGRNIEWARASVSEAASLTARQALEKKVVDGVHDTRELVWKGARQKNSSLPETIEFKTFNKNSKEHILTLISNPNVAYGLMALGALGIYTEITNPGLVVPGAIGAISLALGAITMKIIPIRPGAILLLILGLILIAIEVLTPLPTFGVAGFGGASCLFLSGFFLVDKNQSDILLEPTIWVPVFVLVIGFMLFMGWQALQVLKARPYGQGIDALIGEIGKVVSVINANEATLQVHGELWSARWHGPTQVPFNVGDFVKVIEQKGFTVFVARAVKEEAKGTL